HGSQPVSAGSCAEPRTQRGRETVAGYGALRRTAPGDAAVRAPDLRRQYLDAGRAGSRDSHEDQAARRALLKSSVDRARVLAPAADGGAAVVRLTYAFARSRDQHGPGLGRRWRRSKWRRS